MSTIGDRIRKIRKDNNLNQKAFSKVIGISQGRLSEIEKGKNKPSFDTLYSIKDNYEISLDWLIFGVNYPFKNNSTQNTDEESILESYRNLSEYNKTLIKGMLEIKIYEQNRNDTTYTIDPEDDTKVIKEDAPKYVRTVGRVAAGHGVDEIDLMDMDDLVQVAGLKNVDYALKVVGDSMEPLIPDGSTVLVREQPEVENGDIAIVSIDGKVTCKKYYQENGSVWLESINKKYPDRDITEKDGETRVLGKVILDVNGYSR
jgi:SOS-response transcriptional repressor LexA/DNA-binding XRE family transcriptional regulator